MRELKEHVHMIFLSHLSPILVFFSFVPQFLEQHNSHVYGPSLDINITSLYVFVCHAMRVLYI